MGSLYSVCGGTLFILFSIFYFLLFYFSIILFCFCFIVFICFFRFAKHHQPYMYYLALTLAGVPIETAA